MNSIKAGVLFLLFGFCACKTENPIKKVAFDNPANQENMTDFSIFEVIDSRSAGIDFINHCYETDQFNAFIYEYLYNGSGVAVGDINNDGLPDLYFSGNMVQNRLYLNKGNFQFEDITAKSGTDGGLGYKSGVTMVDINGDGLLDIYVCKTALQNSETRKNYLYINNGDLTFTESAAKYGLDDASFSTQAYFFDMDNDGDLDLYLLNHPLDMVEANNLVVKRDQDGNASIAVPKNAQYESDRVYRNDNGKFKEITDQLGMTNFAFGLSAVVGDFNNDGWLDIYVCNDYAMPDFLYINNKNGTFTDQFDAYFNHSSMFSMGSDFADINNDGCPDLFTVDMYPLENHRQKRMAILQNYDKFDKMVDMGLKAQFSVNSLQLNMCNNTFRNIAFASGVAMTDWSWASLIADFDNDGWKDIYVCNGYRRDLSDQDFSRYKYDSLIKVFKTRNFEGSSQWLEEIPSKKMENFIFRNNRNLTFENVSDIWAQQPLTYSNGAAYADLNNDGYLDIIVNNINDLPLILKNKANTNNNYIQISLNPKQGTSVYGAKVSIYKEDQSFQTQHIYPTRGFLSSVEERLTFGLGKDEKPIRIEIIWPNGDLQHVHDVKPNQQLTISQEKNAGKFKPESSEKEGIYFVDETAKRKLNHKHIENYYLDFKREPLLHRKYSEEGPALAVGDINGDGLDDFFVGGSIGFAGAVFFQEKNGSFIEVPQPDITKDSLKEDVAAVFFDFNNDGFLDLYVCSGGSEYPDGSAEYQDRLYLNDGKGNFINNTNLVPRIASSSGFVLSHDFDNDGLQDLFVFGRITPGKYPVIPRSYLLKNDGKRFIDVTLSTAPALQYVGMVSSAALGDLDSDGEKELVIVGDWMYPKVLKKTNGKYQLIYEQELNSYTGWWTHVNIEDVNGDGKPDLILGNKGINGQIKGTSDKPVELYADDFDNNGSMDAILCMYFGENSYPLALRDRLLDQMIFLKKKFLRYTDYADATIKDILTKDQLDAAMYFRANYFESGILENKGESFTFHPFPFMGQISVIQNSWCYDFTGNGYKDIIIGGNDFSTDVQNGRYDASDGLLLEGDGNFKFKSHYPSSSGFKISGNVRNFLPINLNGGDTGILVTRNNDYMSLLRLKKQPI